VAKPPLGLYIYKTKELLWRVSRSSAPCLGGNGLVWMGLGIKCVYLLSGLALMWGEWVKTNTIREKARHFPFWRTLVSAIWRWTDKVQAFLNEIQIWKLKISKQKVNNKSHCSLGFWYFGTLNWYLEIFPHQFSKDLDASSKA